MSTATGNLSMGMFNLRRKDIPEKRLKNLCFLMTLLAVLVLSLGAGSSSVYAQATITVTTTTGSFAS